MRKKWTRVALAAALSAVLALSGCGGAGGSQEQTETEPAVEEDGQTEASAVTNLPSVDPAAWQYNAEDDVYYQIGIPYCETPADESYENLAVFVPGAYLAGTDNGDGTFTCTPNPDGNIFGYTADTAPIVMPINTPGYSAMAPLTEYTSLTEFMENGLVYVHAGCRGRDAGAPAGVTDLKAAIRYLRYADADMPGSTDRIFVFGMSGGGAQSALVGATGDSELYAPYLTAIGAVQGVSDAVLGSMDWCPITNLDHADEAYEWMMGVTRSGLSEEEQAVSNALAAAYPLYINAAGFTAPDGTALTLEESESGIWQAGSYYEYLKGVIEESLNNFLTDTEFPYDASSSSGGMGGFGGPGGGMGGPGGGRSDGGGFGGPNGGPETENTDAGNRLEIVDAAETVDAENAVENGEAGEAAFEDLDDITRNETSSGVTISGTYETAQDYIDAVNANGDWVTYDAETNTATITSVRDFVLAFKSASKNLGAFDQFDAGQGENTLFGYGDGNGAHFDAVLVGILEDAGSDYAAEYAADLAKTDAQGYSVEQRLNMYTPLYYLLASEAGYRTSTVADFWRIRTGIAQSDTSLTTELNLALALEQYGVKEVDFATVWGQQHVKAERTGSSDTNFIEWVHECLI
ncbi:MAG: tannase [Oscillibacter sp.]|nr:tannase [Oscillibacter sp.]